MKPYRHKWYNHFAALRDMEIRVTISGIGKRPELNGQQGVIVRRANKPNRFGVEIEGSMLSLHMRNLNLLLPISYVSPIEIDKLSAAESEVFANLLAENSNLLNVPTICYGREDYQHMDGYFLIDCYRLRVQDDNLAGLKHGWYDKRCSHSKRMRARVIVSDFLLFAKCANRDPQLFPGIHQKNPYGIWFGVLPYGHGMLADPWPIKEYAERYGEHMVSILRFFAQKIYGFAPGKNSTDDFRDLEAEVSKWRDSGKSCLGSPEVFTSAVGIEVRF